MSKLTFLSQINEQLHVYLYHLRVLMQSLFFYLCAFSGTIFLIKHDYNQFTNAAGFCEFCFS